MDCCANSLTTPFVRWSVPGCSGWPSAHYWWQSYSFGCIWLLTHLPLDKMAAMLADDIFKCISLNGTDRSRIQISLKLVPRSPIDNKPALFQEMAWRPTGTKPSPEPIMTELSLLLWIYCQGDPRDRYYCSPCCSSILLRTSNRLPWNPNVFTSHNKQQRLVYLTLIVTKLLKWFNMVIKAVTVDVLSVRPPQWILLIPLFLATRYIMISLYWCFENAN